MLVKQNQLIHENGSQCQELRTAQSLYRHLSMPTEHRFESIIEGFNRLRTQFMENTPDFDPTVGVGMFSTSGSDPETSHLMAELAQERRVIMGISQDQPYFCGQLFHQAWRNQGISGIGRGQFGGQGDPDGSHRYCQMQLPPIPPPMPS